MPAPARAPVIRVVDDDEAFQEATARLLRLVGYEVRGYVSAGELDELRDISNNAGDFLMAQVEDGPGCLLLDVNMPGPTGLDLQESLAKRVAPFPIVFLTGYGDIPTSVRAMKGGAVDFLTKPVTREALLAAIQAALFRNAEQRLQMEQVNTLRARYQALTAREIEVFERVVAGKLNKQIAYELGAAERTIKSHRAHVMEKMHAASLAELVEIAVQLRAAEKLPDLSREAKKGFRPSS